MEQACLDPAEAYSECAVKHLEVSESDEADLSRPETEKETKR